MAIPADRSINGENFHHLAEVLFAYESMVNTQGLCSQPTFFWPWGYSPRLGEWKPSLAQPASPFSESRPHSSFHTAAGLFFSCWVIIIPASLEIGIEMPQLPLKTVASLDYRRNLNVKPKIFVWKGYMFKTDRVLSGRCSRHSSPQVQHRIQILSIHSIEASN